jgi:type IV pilus assembly protein PilE
MHTMVSNSRRTSAFTLIELMIVVVIVAILALVAIPLYQGNVISAKMSEGIAGCGTIRNAFRVYAAGHAGNYPVLTAQNASQLGVLGVAAGDLAGKYFAVTDYSVTSTAATYTITATLPGYTPTQTYIINQAGAESGTYTTGN